MTIKLKTIALVEFLIMYYAKCKAVIDKDKMNRKLVRAEQLINVCKQSKQNIDIKVERNISFSISKTITTMLKTNVINDGDVNWIGSLILAFWFKCLKAKCFALHIMAEYNMHTQSSSHLDSLYSYQFISITISY